MAERNGILNVPAQPAFNAARMMEDSANGWQDRHLAFLKRRSRATPVGPRQGDKRRSSDLIEGPSDAIDNNSARTGSFGGDVKPVHNSLFMHSG
jgi:hypothetical protein